jgi:hypothetical protein
MVNMVNKPKQDKPEPKPRLNKGKVLQARIPEQLDEALHDRAALLGLSVSTIVRNVLLNTFDLVEGVVTDSTELAQALRGRAKPSSTVLQDPEEQQDIRSVVAWQEAVLNRNGVCEKCNAILPMGERAAIGVPVEIRPIVLCLECLGSLSSRETENTVL